MIDLKRHVIELVQETVRKNTSNENYNLFNRICSDLGLDVKEVALPDGIDGMLEGKTILVNSKIRSEDRKRFTIFHEMMHHLINEDGIIISELHDLTINEKDHYGKELERFCNIGAAEFLMPRKEFTKLYQENGFNVELILNAADHFKASTIAATIQLAQVTPNKCIATVWEYGSLSNNRSQLHNSLFTTQNESTNKAKLHVVYSASSPAASHRWLTKYTTFPDDHLINQAFKKNEMLKDECYIHFPRWKEECTCEALPYKNRVYALFHLTPPPSSDQMQLLNDFS